MITDSFLNNCYGLILGQKQRDLDESTYKDMLHYLKSVEKQADTGPIEIPITMQTKFDLLMYLVQLKVFNGSFMEFLSAIQHSEIYKQHADFVDLKMSEKMSSQDQTAHEEHIHKLAQFCNINSHYGKFIDILDHIRDGTFEDIECLTSAWTDLIKTAASDVAEHEMKTRGQLVSSFNTSDDNCDDIIREIRKKYSKANVVPSGIPELDTGFLNGGFQPSRLYFYAGTSGIGKSLILLNMAMRGAMSKKPFGFFPGIPGMDEPPEEVYLYITMENYVFETWTRLYCAMFNQTKEEMLATIKNPETSSAEILEGMCSLLRPFNSSIQVEYAPAHSISPITIASLIKKYNQEPERRIVKAVYIDYLDLLQSDHPKEHYRLELGEITSSLKALAGNFEIPIITATQLNREAYKPGKNGVLGSDMMSESIQKLFIADFSVIMSREDAGKNKADNQPDDQPKKVFLKVDKNRDGKTGLTHVYFDYPRSRFLTQEECINAFAETLPV
mgnify:CR=1 FL=1